MKRYLSALFLGTVLFAATVVAEEIIVNVAPPRAIVERRPRAPSHGHVWIAGYHRWDGHAYAWVPGRWELPPHPHGVWVAARWEHRHDGYVFIEGHWR